ncbi:hypothetical protein ACEPAI_8637 [Sanghuangporus weigelae]
MSTLPIPSSIKQPDFLRTEEPLAGYHLGGYHPTRIGDTLNGRYRIVQKLGWGEYSTVWLAHDLQTDEYRSVKILTSVASVASKLRELEFLQHAAMCDPGHPGYSRVIRLLDHFRHSGPYGQHLCLVKELLGESVHDLTGYSTVNSVHPVPAKSITRDILSGLDYLHKSGIIHTDLKLDNFLIEIDGMNSYVRRVLESSSIELYPEVQAADGRTISYIPSTPLVIPIEDIEYHKPLRAKIVDLGVAVWEPKIAENYSDVVQPPSVRAPEVFLGAGWDSRCDIWSLGLLLIEMLRGRPALPVGDQGDETLPLRVFCIFRLFGRFPTDLLERGKYSSEYFLPDGSFAYESPKNANKIPKWTELLDIYTEILHPDEYKKLMSFLEAALQLRPEDRWSASQLLEHEWISSEARLLDIHYQ